jgi:hypothetical protein
MKNLSPGGIIPHPSKNSEIYSRLEFRKVLITPLKYPEAPQYNFIEDVNTPKK